MLENKPDVLGVVLAGGQSSRMQGVNKPEIIYKNQTLVARAAQRLAPQVAEVCLSSNYDYDLGVPAVADEQQGQGPLAGVYRALSWCFENRPNIKAILTVPVDAPFFPENLAEQLTSGALEHGNPVVARTADGMQPTFACWPIMVLPKLKAHMARGEAGALKVFLKEMGATNVMFDDPHMFFNINSPEDLEKLQ